MSQVNIQYMLLIIAIKFNKTNIYWGCAAGLTLCQTLEGDGVICIVSGEV